MCPISPTVLFWLVSNVLRSSCFSDFYFHEYDDDITRIFSHLSYKKPPYYTPVCVTEVADIHNVYDCQNKFQRPHDCSFFKSKCYCQKCIKPNVSKRYEFKTSPPSYEASDTILDLRFIGAFRAGTHMLRCEATQDYTLSARSKSNKLCDEVSIYARASKYRFMADYYQAVLRGQTRNITDLLRFGVRFIDLELCVDEIDMPRSCNCLEGQRLEHILREIYLFSLTTGNKDIIFINIRFQPSDFSFFKAKSLMFHLTEMSKEFLVKPRSTCSEITDWPPRVNEVLSRRCPIIMNFHHHHASNVFELNPVPFPFVWDRVYYIEKHNDTERTGDFYGPAMKFRHTAEKLTVGLLYHDLVMPLPNHTSLRRRFNHYKAMDDINIAQNRIHDKLIATIKANRSAFLRIINVALLRAIDQPMPIWRRPHQQNDCEPEL